MRIIRINVNNLPLFARDISIDFWAQQRVTEGNTEMLFNAFSNIYFNNVVSFAGINASGKTTILKVVSFAIELLNNEQINKIKAKDILEGMVDGRSVSFEIIFYTEDGMINKLQTVIKKEQQTTGADAARYIIDRESLWSKKCSTVRSKKTLCDFNDSMLAKVRDGNEEFLMDDVSIIISANKRKDTKVYVRDLTNWTDMNLLRLVGEIPGELISFLDPSLEYIHFIKKERDLKILLKFKNKDEIVLNNPIDLNYYLSSGTIKGINVFISAMLVFQHGGYLIVDEIENHFNREIVSTLIRFFTNSKTNPKGATIIFSTHYVELLDEFDRNDGIYIVRNKSGITAENLADLLNRNDINKSEAYQSGFLGGTTPEYKAYIDLMHTIEKRNDEVMYED